MPASAIPGWNWDITPWQRSVAAQRIPPGGTYLEVGVFMGASLAMMGELRPDISLLALDPWIDEPKPPGWYGTAEHAAAVQRFGCLWFAFLGWMQEQAPDVLRRTRILRGTARNVALIERVDCLFIDGAHDYASVKEDLEKCGPLVKPGGIVAGHDYDITKPDHAGVCRAVDEYHGAKPTVDDTVWWYVQP